MRGSAWSRALSWSKPPGWARRKVRDEYAGRPNACMNWSASPQISESKAVPPASAMPTTVQRSPPKASSAPRATPLKSDAMPFPTTTSCVPNWKGRPWTIWTPGRSSSARGEAAGPQAPPDIRDRDPHHGSLSYRPQADHDRHAHDAVCRDGRGGEPGEKGRPDPERHGEGRDVDHREEGRERLCEPFHDREREQQPEHPSRKRDHERFAEHETGKVPSREAERLQDRVLAGPLPDRHDDGVGED